MRLPAHLHLATLMLKCETRMLLTKSFCIMLFMAAAGAAQTLVANSEVDHVPAPSPSGAAWTVLDKGLGDSNPDKRRQAITAAGSIGPTPAVLKIVAHGLQDKDTLVRQTAAAELGEMKSPDAIPYLKTALDDCTEVSFTAAASLWKLGDKDGRYIFQGVLEGALHNSPGMVQGAVRDAKEKLRNPKTLAMMGVEEAGGALLGPASMGIVVAKDALKDSGSSGRVMAAKYLGEDPDPDALTQLERALDDKNWAVRAAVIKALGQRGNAATIPKLQALLSDTHPAVAYMAAASIIRLNSTPQPPPAGTPGRETKSR